MPGMSVADYLISQDWEASYLPNSFRNYDGDLENSWPEMTTFKRNVTGWMSASRALEIQRMSEKVLVYDLEIKRSIYTGGFKESGIEYANGWEDYSNMGISVLAVWIDWLKLPRVFGEENLNGFADLVNEADLLVGFNNRRFDDRVLAVNGISIPVEKSYDILIEYQDKTGKRCKLDDLSMATIGVGKSDDGALAPVLWQRGERFRVINYCIHDVLGMTYPLFDLIRKNIPLVHPYNKTQLFLRNPITVKHQSDELPPALSSNLAF